MEHEDIKVKSKGVESAKKELTLEYNDKESEQWQKSVVIVNKVSGVTLWLPPHTDEEKGFRWCGSGVWTSEEDLLDAQELELVSKIGSNAVW